MEFFNKSTFRWELFAKYTTRSPNKLRRLIWAVTLLCYITAMVRGWKNTSNGAIRQIRKGRLIYGFQREDYDWEAIGRLAHNNDAYSGNLNYGGISRWDDYIDGFCALSWTLYPDGRYFADSDGYGGDDNDEVVIYVILNADLEVIQPWQPISNIREILSQLRKSRQTNCGLRRLWLRNNSAHLLAPSKQYIGLHPERIQPDIFITSKRGRFY